MKAYLDILNDCLTKGTKSENRTGIDTIRMSSGASFEHNMSDGFPLITTKKMGLRNIATELEFFINGYTDKKWLQDRGCHIWDEWSNPTVWEPVFNETYCKVLHDNKFNAPNGFKEKLKNLIAESCRDLGPIYGWQWRHFGGQYKWNPENPPRNFEFDKPGIDQMANAINTIKKDPTNRRIIVNAWNPVDEKQMALPPCHVMHQLLVHNGKLNLIWTQRSCDMFLGVPYNIASYALLLMLYAKETGLEPGILKGELHDVHIYENHIPQVKEQLSRKPHPLPTVEIPDNNWKGIFEWHAKDGFNLKNYICHEKLVGEIAR